MLRPDLPDDGLPVVERTAVRVVVLDATGAVLLLHAKDGSEPEFGMWWELPGGGLDPGESYAAAAIRELREETGIVVPVSAVGPPTWRRTATFRYRGRRHLQHEMVALIGIDEAAPDLATDERLPNEAEDYPDHRWWAVDDLVGSAERFYPGRLPQLLPALLAGVEVDEPFEFFS